MAPNDIAVAPAPRKVTLALMVRRLAPFVRQGLIDFSEAVDTIMEIAIERGRCDGTPGELPWDRVAALEAWAMNALTREATRG